MHPSDYSSEPDLSRELNSIASQFSRQTVQQIDNALHQQQMSPLFNLIIESFCPDKNTGHIESLNKDGCIVHNMTPSQYQFFVDRPPHSHAYIELMIVLSGSVLNQIGGESFLYHSGQGCIMNTNIHHKEIPVGNAKVLFIELKPEEITELLMIMDMENTTLKNSEFMNFLIVSSAPDSPNNFTKQYWSFVPVVNEAVIQQKLYVLCEEAVNSLRQNRPGKVYLLQAALLGFLQDLCDSSLFTLQTFSSTLNHKEFLASKVELLIRASRGKISKAELEEKLSYNGTYLNRLLKQYRGKNISEYAKDVMLKEAKRLLKESDLSVDEIMRELRITSRGYFFSVFQKETGMTPKEYRRN